MRKSLVAGALVVGTFLGSIGVASAAQPANPGCFGQDRAAWLHANSGAAWGAIAGVRAGDNGSINRDYMGQCGGSPSPGAPA